MQELSSGVCWNELYDLTPDLTVLGLQPIMVWGPKTTYEANPDIQPKASWSAACRSALMLWQVGKAPCPTQSLEVHGTVYSGPAVWLKIV